MRREKTTKEFGPMLMIGEASPCQSVRDSRAKLKQGMTRQTCRKCLGKRGFMPRPEEGFKSWLLWIDRDNLGETLASSLGEVWSLGHRESTLGGDVVHSGGR